jgi:hypothetical protein
MLKANISLSEYRLGCISVSDYQIRKIESDILFSDIL